MIPQSQISKLSNRILKENGGRRVPEYVLERDYCIAWFLIGLSRSPLRNKLVFKGGTALRHAISLNIDFQKILILHFHAPYLLMSYNKILNWSIRKLEKFKIFDFNFHASTQKLIEIAIHSI